ncbi:MAG: hypothetical protein ACRC0E_05955, partial [Soonwooa sp.]
IRHRSASLIDKLEERDRGTEDVVIKNSTDYASKKITEKLQLEYPKGKRKLSLKETNFDISSQL